MIAIGRRTLLKASAAMLYGAAWCEAGHAQTDPGGRAPFEFMVKDLVYQRNGGKERLARLYQPAGTGPFPALLQVHGGAWNNKDRTDGQNAALDLASAGIVVLAIDFRNAPEAPYPASLQDINYGIRWLKAHSGEFAAAPSASAPTAHRAAAIRSCSRRYGPRMRAIARWRCRKLPRWTQS